MRGILYAALALAAATPVAAQIVTPSNLQGWILDDGKGNGDAPTITTAQPRSGDGSLQFAISAGNVAPEAKFGFATPISLSSFLTDGSFGYDFLATIGQTATPTIRLFLTGIGNTGGSTTGALGWFGSTAPGWQTKLFAGNTGAFFFRVTGAGQAADACSNTGYSGGFDDRRQTIDNWINTCDGLGKDIDLSKAMVAGIGVDYGSFPTLVGTTTVYADNVNFSLKGGTVTGNYNFEVTATPEPATLSLLATGLVGIVGFAKRKRARQS